MLKGFGFVTLLCTDINALKITIHWDMEGNGEIIKNHSENVNLRFLATQENWQEFVAGKFNSTIGVLKGKIMVEGDVFAVLPYTSGFTKLALVAREVNKTFKILE